jgi:uncharacterized membrane protein YidH (DUF202 family)
MKNGKNLKKKLKTQKEILHELSLLVGDRNTHLKQKLITHKKLAQERTILANERNTLAYVRTGFASFALGIALIKLFEEHIKYVYAGYTAVIIGIILISLGLIYYPLRKKKIISY